MIRNAEDSTETTEILLSSISVISTPSAKAQGKLRGEIFLFDWAQRRAELPQEGRRISRCARNDNKAVW
jgi:hypothetical protein